MSVKLTCDTAVFHFNKKHLSDPTIPMWVVKAKGESYYVEHVTCDVPWSTKETPDNDHTKGSIKIRSCLIEIDDSNHAIITKLNKTEKILSKEDSEQQKSTIMIHDDDRVKDEIIKLFKHDKVQTIYGACGERYFIFDLLNKNDLTYLTLKYMNKFRVLMPNEVYFKDYKKWLGSNLKKKIAKLFTA